jgi:hypothetical protein
MYSDLNCRNVEKYIELTNPQVRKSRGYDPGSEVAMLLATFYQSTEVGNT